MINARILEKKIAMRGAWVFVPIVVLVPVVALGLLFFAIAGSDAFYIVKETLALQGYAVGAMVGIAAMYAAGSMDTCSAPPAPTPARRRAPRATSPRPRAPRAPAATTASASTVAPTATSIATAARAQAGEKRARRSLGTESTA